MIIATLLLSMAELAEGQVTVRERQSLTVPNEIAPALIPYLQCMFEDRNARIMGARTGDEARSAIEQLKTDCRPNRDRAEQQAREMLRVRNAPEAGREKMIVDALAFIDHSRDNIPEHLDQANSARDEKTD